MTRPISKPIMAAALAMERAARDLEAFAAKAPPLVAYAQRATALSYRRQALLLRRCNPKDVEAAELALRKRMDQ